MIVEFLKYMEEMPFSTALEIGFKFFIIGFFIALFIEFVLGSFVSTWRGGDGG